MLSLSYPLGSKCWNHYPLKRYRQLWPQLTIANGVLCRQYTPSPMADLITVPVLPKSLHRDALVRSHDVPTAGHQGFEKTLARLRQDAYWISMARDVAQYCRECTKCQQCKLSMPQCAPLTSTPIGQPWQMIAVDILEVPITSNNNRYLLVVQDYFTKWADAIPIPDQTAVRITGELVKLFCAYGPPQILHSDQGRNFESSILAQTLEAFGIKKSRTTAYHAQGDGMVERFNRSLLQLLQTYVDSQSDWERYLSLVLHAYRTAPHSSTGVPPFLLMFGRNPSPPPFSKQNMFEANSYPQHLIDKLVKLQDFVEANLTAASHSPKYEYDKRSAPMPTYNVGDLVWVSIPTAGKLDPRWEGGWVVKSVKSPLSIEITNDKTAKIVHVNWLRHRLLPEFPETSPGDAMQQWTPPTVDHVYIPLPAPPVQPRYPSRHRNPPDHYGW